MTKGFAFQIDYDEALAQDEQEIAMVQFVIDNGLYVGGDAGRPSTDYWVWMWWLATDGLHIAEKLGATRIDALCWQELMTEDCDSYVEHKECCELTNSQREEAKATFDRVVEPVAWFLGKDRPDLKAAKKARSQAKASRSRHLRNKAKHGG